MILILSEISLDCVLLRHSSYDGRQNLNENNIQSEEERRTGIAEVCNNNKNNNTYEVTQMKILISNYNNNHTNENTLSSQGMRRTRTAEVCNNKNNDNTN